MAGFFIAAISVEHADMARLLEEDKGLRVILKEFPVLGQGSEEAAQVAVVVNKIAPDKYRAR